MKSKFNWGMFAFDLVLAFMWGFFCGIVFAGSFAFVMSAVGAICIALVFILTGALWDDEDT